MQSSAFVVTCTEIRNSIRYFVIGNYGLAGGSIAFYSTSTAINAPSISLTSTNALLPINIDGLLVGKHLGYTDRKGLRNGSVGATTYMISQNTAGNVYLESDQYITQRVGSTDVAQASSSGFTIPNAKFGVGSFTGLTALGGGTAARGTDSSHTNGAHTTVYGSADTYPLSQQLNWTHDNINFTFDGFFDGSQWRNSHSTNPYQIRKFENKLNLMWGSNSTATAGTTTSFRTRVCLGQYGVGINTTNLTSVIPAIEFFVDAQSDFKQCSHFTSDNYSVIMGSIGYLTPGGAATGNYPYTYAAYSINALRIRATQIDCYSDIRAKKNIEVRDGKKDLELLSKIPIKEYRWKDEKKGAQKHIGVIAQEIETVFPDCISNSTDFVPNSYEKRDIIEIDDKSFTIIGKPVEDGKVKFFYTFKDGEQMGIGEIKDNTVTHKQGILNQSEMFLYGREVDDFRNVDYQSLLGLNMSVTQELAKMVKDLQDRLIDVEKELLHYKKYSYTAGVH